ncbi:MAG: hypothetical protein K6347_06330 [Campylobacterales bacterium]
MKDKKSNHFRYCRLKQNWVAFAPKRVRRPLDLSACASEEWHADFFAAGNEFKTPDEIARLDDANGWVVRVVPNLYRIVEIESPKESGREGFFEWMGGYGAHEIVIESPTPKEIWELEWPKILEMIRLRYLDLCNDPNISYIQVFKNHGMMAGASVAHPHSQIVGLPFIPPLVRREIEGALAYYLSKGRALVVDEAKEEERLGERVVHRSDHFIAYCPYASSHPFSVRIAPLGEDWLSLGAEGSRELGILMASILRKMRHISRHAGFNILYYLTPPRRDNSPFNKEHRQFFPTYLDIVPRLSMVAGFELSSGIFVNFVMPEEAAAWLNAQED